MPLRPCERFPLSESFAGRAAATCAPVLQTIVKTTPVHREHPIKRPFNLFFLRQAGHYRPAVAIRCASRILREINSSWRQPPKKRNSRSVACASHVTQSLPPVSNTVSRAFANTSPRDPRIYTAIQTSNNTRQCSSIPTLESETAVAFSDTFIFAHVVAPKGRLAGDEQQSRGIPRTMGMGDNEHSSPLKSEPAGVVCRSRAFPRDTWPIPFRERDLAEVRRT